MIVLDANVVIALLDKDNKYNRQATKLIVELGPQYLALAALTWAEILVGAVKAEVVDQTIDAVQRKMGVMIVSDQSNEWPLNLAKARARTGLKIPDAVVFATAEALDAKIVTFDDKLTHVARQAGRL